MLSMNNYGHYGATVLCQVFFQERHLFLTVKRTTDKANYCLSKFKTAIRGGQVDWVVIKLHIGYTFRI